MAQPMTAAVIKPAAAQISAPVTSPDAPRIASRKSTVSRPSRMTATNASPTRARVEPRSKAAATPASSSPFMERPCARIQNSIHVRTTTAMIAVTPSNVAWTCSGSRPIVATTTIPTTTDRASAAATPMATSRSASRRPALTR